MGKLLSLGTDSMGLFVEIDGVPYDLPDPDDTPLHDLFIMEKARNRCAILKRILEQPDVAEGETDPKEAAAAEFDELIVQFSSALLKDVPKDVQAKLKPVQRLALMNSYSVAVVKARAKDPTPGDGTESSPPDGMRSSATSEGSTEVAGKTGTGTP